MATVQRDIRGNVVVSDIIDGYRVQRIYIGYSDKEALAKFYAEFPQAKHNG